MPSRMNDSITHCTRCGTCCQKGGPALHVQDLELVVQKKIMPENLYTIRKGELVYDNIKGGLSTTGQEIIKIRSVFGATTCIYYDDAQKQCLIHEVRPVECRVMTCWDTKPAEAFYNVDRLDRASVFGQVGWIMDLIETHEEKCGYPEIDRLCRLRQAGDSTAGHAISEALRYDAEMRRVVVEKTGMDAGMMDLIFGRVLEKTLPAQFGIKLFKSRC